MYATIDAYEAFPDGQLQTAITHAVDQLRNNATRSAVVTRATSILLGQLERALPKGVELSDDGDPGHDVEEMLLAECEELLGRLPEDED